MTIHEESWRCEKRVGERKEWAEMIRGDKQDKKRGDEKGKREEGKREQEG